MLFNSGLYFNLMDMYYTSDIVCIYVNYLIGLLSHVYHYLFTFINFVIKIDKLVIY